MKIETLSIKKVSQEEDAVCCRSQLSWISYFPSKKLVPLIIQSLTGKLYQFHWLKVFKQSFKEYSIVYKQENSGEEIKIFDIPHQANPIGMFVRLKYIYGWRRHTNSPSDAVGYYLNRAKDKKIKDRKFQRYIVTHCSMPPTVFGEGCGLLWIGGFSLRHCPVACYNINMEKHNIKKYHKY